MHATRTWVLIADAAHARAYQSTGQDRPLEPVPGFDMNESVPYARDLSDHQPGSSQPSVGSAHHTVGASDPRRDAKRNFATRVADALEDAQQEGAYDKLVIVCPPAMLGDLRAALPKAVTKHVIAELDKDLVKTPAHDLLSHLSGIPALTRH